MYTYCMCDYGVRGCPAYGGAAMFSATHIVVRMFNEKTFFPLVLLTFLLQHFRSHLRSMKCLYTKVAVVLPPHEQRREAMLSSHKTPLKTCARFLFFYGRKESVLVP